MSVNCLLFHGLSNDHPISNKQAGAARIATELRKNGYSVQVVDCTGLSTRHPIWGRIIKKFVGPETLWVGFSTTIIGDILGIPQAQLIDYDPDPFGKKKDDTTVWINEFMDLVRQENPKISFVHGGAGAYDLRAYGWWKFSYGTDQEIVDFTNWCKHPDQPPTFSHCDRVITSNGFKNFTTSTIEWTEHDIIYPGQVLPIEVSRGCIFRCKFCSFPYNGKKNLDFIKEAETLRNELEKNYSTWGITEYLFSDDTYNDSISKMQLLHDEVFSKLSFKIGFTTYARLDLLMKQGNEGIDLLANSGLSSVLFGIESLTPSSARAIGKSGDSQRQIDFLWHFKNRDPHIFIGSGFIFGLPGDTRESLDYTGNWLLSDKNPLDWWLVETLYISPPDRVPGRGFYSEIDLDPVSYGYKLMPHTTELYKNAKNRWRVNWQINDINLSYCVQQEEKILNQSRDSDRYFAAGFNYPTYRNLGFTRDEIRNRPMKELVVTEEQKRRRILDYYKRVLSL